MPEPLPVKEFLDELEVPASGGVWDVSNVAAPKVIEVTGSTNDPLRFNLNMGDVVFGRAGDPAQEETPIGNWTYGNRVYNIVLEVYTTNSGGRQRLYDIVGEIRRICHARMHSLTSFQRIKFVSFSEATQDQVNIWTGNITIQLENNAFLLETT